MATHRFEIVPRFGELDPYNHVNHAVYVAWFEAARCVALDDIGQSLPDLADRGLQIVVTRLEVRFRQPATARDRLVVTTEVAEIRRASSRWAQRLIRVDDSGDGDTGDAAGGEVLVEGLVTAAMCDDRGRPTRPPADVMEALATLSPEAG